MTLYEIEVPKAKLLSMPEIERGFFVQILLLSDEILMLQKLLVCITDNGRGNIVVQNALNAKILFLVRMLAGKLWEGWKVIKIGFLNKGTVITDEHRKEWKEFGMEGLESLERIIKYLVPKDNMIEVIRNQYAFHYSEESATMIEKLIQNMSDSNPSRLYFHETHGNCFYQMSHDLLNEGMLDSVPGVEDDKRKIIQVLLMDVVQLSHYFNDFIGDYLVVIAKKYLGIDKKFEFKKVEIPKPPKTTQVPIPCFISVPDSYSKSKRKVR